MMGDTRTENQFDEQNTPRAVLTMLREVLHGGDSTELLQYLDKANAGDGEVIPIPSEYLAPLIRGEKLHVMNGPQTDAVDKRELAKQCAAYMVKEAADHYRERSGKRATPRHILTEIEDRALGLDHNKATGVNAHFKITLLANSVIGPVNSEMETQKRHGLHERAVYSMPAEVVHGSKLHAVLMGILDWLDETYLTPQG